MTTTTASATIINATGQRLDRLNKENNHAARTARFLLQIFDVVGRTTT